MRLATLLCLILCLNAPLLAQDKAENTEGIQFFHGSWEETLAESKRTGKLIFIDAYTSWCGPCKKMAKSIFPLKEVGDYYNKNFVNAKFDMEKGDGRKVRSKYNVNSFPTFLFVDGDGKLHYSSKGAKPADRFIGMGKTALSKVDYSQKYAGQYEDGSREPELLYNYAYSLMKSNKPSLKVANEYLKTQEDVKSEKNLNFTLDLATEADSRIFDMMITNRAELEKLRGKNLVDDKIMAACQKTVEKAVQFESGDLLAEAKTKMSANLPEKASSFAYSADIDFAKGTKNGAAFAKSCDKYLKKEAKKNAAENNRLASLAFSNFKTDKTVMAKAEKWAGIAAENGGLYKYHMTYANILFQNNKVAEAAKIANKAKEIGDRENINTRDADALLKKISAPKGR